MGAAPAPPKGAAAMVRHTLAAIVGLGLLVSVASAQTPTTTPPTTDPHMTVNQRLENQKDRIQAGTQDDQLTKGERTRLRANDAAIHAQEKVYRQANDGKLTNGEKARLNRELNRNSRQIYRARHNSRKPKA
jgi:hypothetical protein